VSEERAVYRTSWLESEADVVQVITEGLALKGFTVLRVGQHRADLSGQDAGVPDLLVTHPRWPEGVWIGLECKGTKTRLSPEQRRLHAARRIYVVRSWEDGLQAVKQFEEALSAVSSFEPQTRR
jgi:hypothetical protein